MIKAGVVINDWKLPIFKEVFDSGGVEYIELDGPFPSSTILQVNTDSAEKLEPWVRKAEAKAAKSKMH